jgi:Tol biopolymer transport system component
MILRKSPPRSLALPAVAACLFALVAAFGKTGDSTPPYASAQPITEPRLFAPGAISTGDFESHPAFTPDGRTLYYLKDNPAFTFWTIVVSNFRNGRWTDPEVAPFSGRFSDADPFITSDGKKFFFISSRPVAGQPADKPKDDLDIWVMELTAKGWGEPANLGAPVNSAGNEWYPTVAADGTLYFGSDRPGGKGQTDLYRCRFVDGKYGEAENLGDAVNTRFNEFEPYVAPDESYVIFMAARQGGVGGSDLWVTYNRAGKWTEAKNLGDRVNTPGSEYSPKVSPDGKYFFYSSTGLRGAWDATPAKPMNIRELTTKLRAPQNGLGDIYQIDLSALKLER